MASVGGKLTAWKHEASVGAGSNTDFSAKTKSVNQSWETSMLDSTPFGKSSKTYVSGLKDSTVSAEYFYDTTIFGQLNAIYANGGSITFEFSPDGTASGKPKATGSMLMSSFSQPAEVDGILMITVDWQVSDDVTFGTH